MGGSAEAVKAGALELIKALPKVTGADGLYSSADLEAVLRDAERESGKMGDEFISVEHLMLGIFAKGDMKVKDLLRKNSLNSEQSWAARVLLCAKTSVGLFTFAIIFAIVNVLPEPVTPSKTCSFKPFWMPSVNFLIASG